MATPRCLVELRVLDGPNRHFVNPTIQLRLDCGRLLAASEEEMREFGRVVGADLDPVGEPGSGTRVEAARDWLRTVTRRLAALDGVERLAVRTGPGHAEGELVVAFPWSREGRAAMLGRWVAWTLDDVGETPLQDTFELAARRLREVRPGPRPTVVDPHVPTVGVTGTNGKTTTTRLVAHLVLAAGLRTAWNSTDGVVAADPDGPRTQLESGDWAGFNGAQRVLGVPGLQVAVLEVARGGILRRGMGVSGLDVGVVTNVSADHMGDMGVHTLEDLAAVKSTVVRAVRPGGWAVLNADDERVAAMARQCDGGVVGFSPDPDSAGLARLLAGAGDRGQPAVTVTVVDGTVVVDGISVVDLVEVPATIAGLSPHNVANVLAAVGAAHGIDLPLDAVRDGLRTFGILPSANRGRLNVYQRDGVVLIVDIAHNEDSLRALCGVGRGLVDGGSLRLVTGTMGDRTDQQVRAMGAVAAGSADDVVIARKVRYLRGAEPTHIVAQLNAGAAAVGAPPMPEAPDEVAALDLVLGRCEPGDVVAAAIHVELEHIAEALAERGFSPATPEEVAGRARAAAGRVVD